MKIKTVFFIVAVAALALGARAEVLVQATGGTVTYAGAADVVHTFATTGTHTFVPSQDMTVRVLVVGGGGAGGGCLGGGGGGGQVQEAQDLALTAGTVYSITVGAGGDPWNGTTPGDDLDWWYQGGPGGTTIAFGISSAGGGGGGAWRAGSPTAGANGAGGSAYNAGGSPTVAGGHTGGASGSSGVGGGGAGAGEDGGIGNAVAGVAGHGGAGVTNDISGVKVSYAAGGGGGAGLGSVGTGGEPGDEHAGRGAKGWSTEVGENGEDGYGAGGGGGMHSGKGSRGGAGGCGTVIVRYASFANDDTVLEVAGDPQKLSVPTPTYGYHNGYAAAQEETCSVAVTVVPDSATAGSYKLIGWDLYDIDLSTGTATLLRASTNTTVAGESFSCCKYVHTRRARLVWRWQWGLFPTGVTRTWTGAGSDALASTAANWQDGVAPLAGDAILLDETGRDKPMTWDFPCAYVGAWTQTAGYTNVVTITTSAQSDDDFFRCVGDVSLQGGIWTHAVNPKPATKGYDTYRLKVKVGGAFALGASAKVDVSEKGLPAGCGLGDTGGNERGASHGGRGKQNNSPCYGSVKRPYKCGAGGSANVGGGVFMLEASGAATLNGTVAAHGSMTKTATTARAYGASGGAISIIAATISGSGTVEANAGNLYTGYGYHSPAGGGRIALVQTAADATYATLPTDVTAYSSYLLSSSTGEHEATTTHFAGAGTVYYEVPSDNGRGKLIVRDRFANMPDITHFNHAEFNTVMDQDLDFGEIEVSHGGSIKFCVGAAGTNLANTVISGDANGYLVPYADLKLGDAWTWEGASVWPIEGANIYGDVSTVVSNTVIYQTSATARGDVTVVTNGVITHAAASAAADGYRVDLTFPGNLTVREGGRIDVSRKGCDTRGFGTDTYWVGSGHGGRGSPNGAGKTTAAACYGDVREPVTYGTYGAHAAGGGVAQAGGFAKLTVTGTARIDGIVSASASTGGAYQSPSAGSLQLTAARLVGSGLVTATGAPSSAGSCSGGGRIAVTLTDSDATFADFAGDIVAFGRGCSSWVTDIRRPFASKETRSGAGTIYLRERGAALDAGTLLVSQFRDDGKVNAYGITELCESTTGLDYGAIVVTNGGILAINGGTAVTASRWENRSTLAVADAATCHVKGDADGVAYLAGAMTFPTLVFDSSVREVVLAADAQIAVTGTLSLVGAADRVIRIRCATPGATGRIALAAGATATLGHLTVDRGDPTGGCTLELGADTVLTLAGDVRLAAIVNTEASARIDLGGHALILSELVHALALDGSAPGATRREIRAAQASTAQITNRGTFGWVSRPTLIMVK